jgi:hypothetical protein
MRLVESGYDAFVEKQTPSGRAFGVYGPLIVVFAGGALPPLSAAAEVCTRTGWVPRRHAGVLHRRPTSVSVIYHPGMIRPPLIVLPAVVGLAVLGAAGVASGEPGTQPCSYTLSPPRVAQKSGVSVVTAALSPAGCDRSEPFLSVACVQMQGSDGAGQCTQAEGLGTAQVYYQPYRPGATYISTGRGCASSGNPPRPFCQPLGPYSATL